MNVICQLKGGRELKSKWTEKKKAEENKKRSEEKMRDEEERQNVFCLLVYSFYR